MSLCAAGIFWCVVLVSETADSVAFTEHLSTTPSAASQQLRRLYPHWKSIGIRAKILIPLIILMTLSLLSSIAGFLLSTDRTRDRILDEQITEDAHRIMDTLIQDMPEVIASAQVLARDPDLIRALEEDQAHPGGNSVPDMDRRALSVYDRFDLDQVMVLNADGHPRVNIAAQSYLSKMSENERNDLLNKSSTDQAVVVKFEDTWLLAGAAPILARHSDSAEDALLGTAYTFLNINEALQRTRRMLDIATEVMIVNGDGDVQAVQSPVSWNGYRVQMFTLELGGKAIPLRLQRSEYEINAIVGSSLQAMLISNIATFLVLVLAGAWLAQSFTRPLLKFVGVAETVAAGDLSRRANLTHRDEIGQLGRAFDHATDTIAELLDQRARVAGELHAILQSIADGVLAIDLEERIIILNPAAASLLSQSPEALIGQPLGNLAQVEDPVLATSMHQVVDQIRDELHTPEATITEENITLGLRIVRLQSAPILGSGRIHIGAVMVLQDITRAVESDRAKSKFIATASHELRTPLSGLKGYIDLFTLTSASSLTEEQHLFLSVIQRQTNNLITLVNDLLEMARIEQSKVSLERRWVHADSAIDEAMLSLRSLIEQRQAHIDTDISENLPPLWIDSMHLRRMLMNLISNAVKYVHTGGNVWIRAYELNDPTLLPSPAGDQDWSATDSRSVVIEIEDNGVGIKEADQPHIFNRFFRSGNPLSIEVGGTGLGLAITKALVHLHNGQIGFRSVEGEGSRFWIRLHAHTTEPVQSSDLEQYEVNGIRDVIETYRR